MNNDEIIEELEKVESKYKDKVFATGELNIYEMVKSCKYKIQELQQENQQLKEQLEKERKSRKKAIKYLYEHSQYVDEYGIHYIKEDEYCVDYLLDILNIKENK